MLWSVRAPLFAVALIVGCASSSENPPRDDAKPGDTNFVPGDSPGALAVRNRRCGSCHTEDPEKPLAGSRQKLTGLSAEYELYPPNLTPDPDTGIGNWNDLQLGEAIRNGVDADGVFLCPQMRHFDDMSDEELASIIAYLRSLPPVSNAVPGSICPPLKFRE
jgi:mono/diheme cytochrome c family protein